MSTSLATLSRPASQPRSSPRAPTPAQSYPLFGFRLAIHRMAIPSREADINIWLAAKHAEKVKTPWSILWRQCQYELRRFFKSVWIVELPRQARQLQPGIYVFETMNDFIHVPGNPPQVVRACYEQALMDLPNCPLVYLDLLWDVRQHGRVLLTPARFQGILEAESRKFCRTSATIEMTRQVVALARERITQAAREVEEQTTDREGYRTIIDYQLPQTLDEAVRVLRLSRRQLLKTIAVSFIVKFDPAIVFPDPKLCPTPAGRMPLGLIAHWD